MFSKSSLCRARVDTNQPCYRLLFIFIAAGIVFDDANAQDRGRNSADETYLFYLHGRIIEDAGPTPTHPKFGLYDYPAIVEALGSRGATVVSEVRKSGTEMDQYARKTIENIEKLISDCKDLADRGSGVTSFEELRISTGKEHGAFYLPRPVWVVPLLARVHGDGA